jgi:hypothetical protein
MLLRLYTGATRGLLAEVQKTADLVAKLGQRRIIRLLEISGSHAHTLYRMTI